MKPIQFTRHALDKMQERAIVEKEVYEVFGYPILVLEQIERVIIGRTHAGRFLTLVMDRAEDRLITLWPSSRKQRRLYQEKIGGQ